MNEIKLFVTDLDGTLLLDDHITVSERTKQTLRRLQSQGVLMCASTGRMRGMLPEDVAGFGFDYIMTSNGASCYDVRAQKNVFKINLTEEKARLVWSVLENYDCLTQWFVNDELLMDRHNFSLWRDRLHAVWHRNYLEAGRGTVVEDIHEYLDQGVPGLEKIGVMQFPKEDFHAIVSPLQESGQLEISTSLGTNFEITDRAADKGLSLRRLCSYMGIDPSQAIAFGDGPNDISMLRAAGTGVAMGNSFPEVIEKIGTVTLTNEQDGVADYLEKYILK